MKLHYKIELLSDWHIGSGLDSATDANALVLKDENKLPYIPGKTIKGLIKDAVYDLVDIGKATDDQIKTIFGRMIESKESNASFSGKAFFSDATLSKDEYAEIQTNQLSDFLYRNIASTAIDKNGVAKQQSLRVSQVTMPLQLVGYIDQVDPSDCDLLETAFKLVRHLGVHRNRGLGRCKFYHLENNQA